MSDYFIKFDQDTGNIVEIINEVPGPEETFITTTLEEVLPFLEGLQSTDFYHVVMSPQTKKYELQARVYEETMYSSPSDQIFEIPTTKIESDINIKKDNQNKKWIVYIGSELKRALEEQNTLLKARLNFSVTQKGNPNVLYQYFEVVFNGNKLINVEFQNNVEAIEDYSIYTTRKFENYGHF